MIPHYRPIRPGGNPFALAIWLGVWTSGGNLKRGYRIVVGRLWVLVKPSGLPAPSHVNVPPIERYTRLIGTAAPPPPEPLYERKVSPASFEEA